MITKSDNKSILYTNVNIYGHPGSNAILCKDGLIQAIGSARLLKGRASKIPLNNNWLYPGFNDTHLHILGLGEYLSFIQLKGLKSIDEILGKIERYISSDKVFGRTNWVRGMGWDQNLWENKIFPDKKVLDRVTGDVPVCLSRVDGHAFWVNSAVIKMAGITNETPDPVGGKIIRMENSDEPSGLLIDKAMNFVSDIIPGPDAKQCYRFVSSAIKHLGAFGITSVGDAGTFLDTFEILKDLQRRQELPLRVNVMIPWREDKRKYRVDDNRFLLAKTFKVYLDGALGSRGAALFDPYTDDTENSGLILENINEVTDFIGRSNSDGYQVAIHAIGDKANHLSLNAFQNASENSTRKIRNRIEHAQIVRESDITRFAELGVLPAVQPIHCVSDKDWIETRLGPKRTASAYPWSSFIKSGSVVLGGSDAPVESADPLVGMFAASTRRGPNSHPEKPFYPNQSLSVPEALKAYTSWAAAGTNDENMKGSLSAGQFADFAVLSKPIELNNPQSLLETRVIKTIVNGKTV